MKPNAPFVSALCRRLQPLGPVRARAMFGGCGLFLEDAMLAIVVSGDGARPGRLFFKVDEDCEARFAAAGAERFTYPREGRRISLSFREAPEGSLEDPEELLRWAEPALAAARRARAKRRPRRRKR